MPTAYDELMNLVTQACDFTKPFDCAKGLAHVESIYARNRDCAPLFYYQPQGMTLLHAAIRRHDVQIVEKLLTHANPLIKLDCKQMVAFHYNSLIHYAILCAQPHPANNKNIIEIMKLLHKHGLPYDLRHPDGGTLAHAAAIVGALDILQFIQTVKPGLAILPRLDSKLPLEFAKTAEAKNYLLSFMPRGTSEMKGGTAASSHTSSAIASQSAAALQNAAAKSKVSTPAAYTGIPGVLSGTHAVPHGTHTSLASLNAAALQGLSAITAQNLSSLQTLSALQNSSSSALSISTPTASMFSVAQAVSGTQAVGVTMSGGATATGVAGTAATNAKKRKAGSEEDDSLNAASASDKDEKDKESSASKRSKPDEFNIPPLERVDTASASATGPRVKIEKDAEKEKEKEKEKDKLLAFHLAMDERLVMQIIMNLTKGSSDQNRPWLLDDLLNAFNKGEIPTKPSEAPRPGSQRSVSAIPAQQGFFEPVGRKSDKDKEKGKELYPYMDLTDQRKEVHFSKATEQLKNLAQQRNGAVWGRVAMLADSSAGTGSQAEIKSRECVFYAMSDKVIFIEPHYFNVVTQQPQIANPIAYQLGGKDGLYNFKGAFNDRARSFVLRDTCQIIECGSIDLGFSVKMESDDSLASGLAGVGSHAVPVAAVQRLII